MATLLDSAASNEGAMRGPGANCLLAAMPAVLACMVLALAPGPADGPARAGTLPQAANVAAPFPAGERLEYRVGWQTSLTAATAQVQVVERQRFRGRLAWHFQAHAHTIEPLRYLYPLDDQFDSYADTQTLSSLQYELHLREAGKQSDSVIHMTGEGDPAEGEGPTVRVPAGTRDPLGAFYQLRLTDWRRTPETQTPVYDGKNLYEVRAHKLAEQEEIQVPAGRYAATKVEVRVYERGREVPQTRFWVWLAQNPARTPVQVEAELPWGSLRVELTRAQ